MAILHNRLSKSDLQYNDLAGLGRVLSQIEVGPILAMFSRKTGRGRPSYSRLPIIYAFLSSYYLNIRTIQGLADRLNNDPALRRVCGFTGAIPSRSTFSRSFSVLAHNKEIVYEVFEELTHQVMELNPRMGTLIAVDATTIAAYSNPNKKRTRDPEAGWTKAHSAAAMTDDGMEWVFGYKAHVLVCVELALPLAFKVTPANKHESQTIPHLVSKTHQSYDTFHPIALMADRGYDSRANSQFLHGQSIAPIIPRINPRGRATGKPIYTLHGEPTCLGGQPMEFVGTNPMTGLHGFRCPLEGCQRRKEPFKGYTVCDDVVWENPDENVYEVGGRVSRASAEWQHLYDMRWEIERYFSLLKDNQWVASHRCRGLAKVDLHITLAILMYQAMALDRMVEQGAEVSRRNLFRAA